MLLHISDLADFERSVEAVEEFLKRDGAYSTFDTQRMLEALYGSLKEAKQTGDILD